MFQKLRKNWYWCFLVAVMATIAACGSFSGSVTTEGTLNVWVVKVDWHAKFAKVENDGGTLEGQWFDENGEPIGEPFDIGPGVSTHSIPEGAKYYSVKEKSGKDGAEKYIVGYIGMTNFSQAVIMAHSYAEAMEEYQASILGNPSPVGATTLGNVLAKPVTGPGSVWEVLVAEEREIRTVEIWFNGELLADTNDGYLSYDPAIGGRWVATIDYQNPPGKGFAGKVKGLVSAHFKKPIPLEGKLEFRWTTADNDAENVTFEYVHK